MDDDIKDECLRFLEEIQPFLVGKSAVAVANVCLHLLKSIVIVKGVCSKEDVLTAVKEFFDAPEPDPTSIQ